MDGLILAEGLAYRTIYVNVKLLPARRNQKLIAQLGVFITSTVVAVVL